MSEITLVINGISVRGNTRELLLTQIEKAGLKPEFQCRDGVCGFCRCRLVGGNVKQFDALALTEPDEILTCCSVPTSDVELQFSYEVHTLQDSLSTHTTE